MNELLNTFLIFSIFFSVIEKKRTLFILFLSFFLLFTLLNSPVISDLIKYIFFSPKEGISAFVNQQDILEESVEEQQFDKQNVTILNAEDHFLLAISFIEKIDYENTLIHLDKAFIQEYEFKRDLYYVYGSVYEALGDQFLADNNFSGAFFYYSYSVQYLVKSTLDQNYFYHNIDEVKNLLSLVELKKENCSLVVKFFTNYSADKDFSYSDYLYDLEVISRNWSDLEMWEQATTWNYVLFNQHTSVSRKERIITDLNYTLGLFKSSDDFEHDSSVVSETAFVNDTSVNFRHEPLLDNNIIRKFQLYEKVQILQRSAFTQTIEGVTSYWYNVISETGTVGWIFGQYLFFLPPFYNQLELH